MKNITIVDDHPLIRKSLLKLLIKNFNHINFDEASSGEEILDKLKNGFKTDLILLDLNMPGIGGIETCRKITKQYPGIKIVILTLNEECLYLDQVIDIGANAYVDKIESKEKIYSVIREQMVN